MGFDGCCIAGSSGETRVWVIRLTTGTSIPAAASSFCSDWASRYPISPWLAAPQTSSVCPYTTSEARSERSNCAPTCGPLPWVMTSRYPRRTKPTIASAVRRVFANCSATVPFSPARMSELPPTATSAVFDITFAIRHSLFASSNRQLEACWRKAKSEANSTGRQMGDCSGRRQGEPPPPICHFRPCGLRRPLQPGFTHPFAFLCFGALHQFQHDRLLRMQPVLCLQKDERSRRIDHLIGDFLTAMRRQTMHKDGIGFRAGEEFCIDLVRLENLVPRFRLRLLAHAGPHVGVHHVRSEGR